MKKIFLLCLIACCLVSNATAQYFDPILGRVTAPDKNPTFESVTMGSAISAINVEKTIWEVKDSNGDVVASCTVVCSDITDGSQDCSIKFYVMVAGTLTLDSTLDGP
jgi:hypothetical protein